MKTGNRSRQITLLGLLTAILFVMGMTPLGYLKVGILSITFNMIPVAIGAAALGHTGGAVLGAVFGLTSFLQCLGFGGGSEMGIITLQISPFLTIIHRFVPRIITGFLLGVIYKGLRKRFDVKIAGGILGFLAAFLNTVLFLSMLVLLFWDTQYLQDAMAGRNVLVYLGALAGVNAVVEMIVSPLVVAALLNSLERAGAFKR